MHIFMIFVLIIGTIAVDKILNIHKYLMEKNNIIENGWIY